MATLAGKRRTEGDARVVYKTTLDRSGGNTSADRAQTDGSRSLPQAADQPAANYALE
jgi:hypothetical protein